MLSGGILGNGSIGSYISNSARLAMGMGLARIAGRAGALFLQTS